MIRFSNKGIIMSIDLKSVLRDINIVVLGAPSLQSYVQRPETTGV